MGIEFRLENKNGGSIEGILNFEMNFSCINAN